MKILHLSPVPPLKKYIRLNIFVFFSTLTKIVGYIYINLTMPSWIKMIILKGWMIILVVQCLFFGGFLSHKFSGPFVLYGPGIPAQFA